MSETTIFILTLIVMASAMLAYILHTDARIKRLEEKRKRKDETSLQ